MALYGSPTSNIDHSSLKAPQACLSCRKQKRKCNKGLPSCALCERMGRSCDYSDASPAPTTEDFNALRQQIFELEGLVNGRNESSMLDNSPYAATPSTGTISGAGESVGHGSNTVYVQQDPVYQNVPNRFPAIAFLDSEAFKYGGVPIPKPAINIPVEVLEILGDGTAVQVIISDYFDTVHLWMPIISKKRMTRNMLNPMWEAGPDLALLFLSMKLVISRPQEGLESPQNPIYTATKRFLALTEASGMVSIMVLQAYILVTLYEIGQAIYPAAWMTAGACVRYGLLLGINEHDAAVKLLGHSNTWTEMEERKRVWSGVLIVDRVVTIGGQGRFLASEDPSPDFPLPVDTRAWDDGEMVLPPSNTSSSNSEVPCPFARLCQATYLLGKVLRHHLAKDLAEVARFRQASALYLEISELTRQLAEEAVAKRGRDGVASDNYLPLATPMAICFSALCNLCDPYACIGARAPVSNSAEEAAMQVQAVEGIKNVSASIKDFSEQIIARTSHSLDADRISPLIMDALYAAAANFAWTVRESGDVTCQIGLESIRHCLRRLGLRWRSAAEYVRVLEAQEFTYAVGSGPV